jgi:hypothetical protein
VARGFGVSLLTCLVAGNDVLVGLICFDPNTADLYDVLGLFERTILFPIVYDALGIGWPNALQGAELINRSFLTVRAGTNDFKGLRFRHRPQKGTKRPGFAPYLHPFSTLCKGGLRLVT